MDKLGIDFLNIIAYFINFAVLGVVLWLFAYKPVLAMLARRKQEIADGLAAADKVRAEAEQERTKFESELQNVQQSSQEEAAKIAKATADMREKILAEAQNEANVIKEKARADMAAERAAIQAEMHRQMADLTVSLTRKVVGQSIDEAQHRELVGQFLAELGD